MQTHAHCPPHFVAQAFCCSHHCFSQNSWSTFWRYHVHTDNETINDKVSFTMYQVHVIHHLILTVIYEISSTITPKFKMEKDPVLVTFPDHIARSRILTLAISHSRTPATNHRYDGHTCSQLPPQRQALTPATPGKTWESRPACPYSPSQRWAAHTSVFKWTLNRHYAQCCRAHPGDQA